MAFTSTPAESFWRAMGLSRSSYYNKLKGASPWTASEVQIMATLLGVSVLDLYEGNIPRDLPRWGGDFPLNVVTHWYGGWIAPFPRPRRALTAA